MIEEKKISLNSVVYEYLFDEHIFFSRVIRRVMCIDPMIDFLNEFDFENIQ